MPATPPAKQPVIEIFRTGTHTAMNGVTLSFAEADLASTAAAYDPAKHKAPLVVGHPKHDAPAYGWVAGLSVAGDRLRATCDQVNPAFAEMVRAGAFKTVSASFYAPDAPGNPTPGVYHLRHVGFLGAQPPAIKGLAPVDFAGSDEGVVTVEFGEVSGGDVGWLARMVGITLRTLREWVIERDGTEAADKIIPAWRIDDANDLATRMQALDAVPAGPAYSEPEEEPHVADKTTTSDADELRRREEELRARELAFAERARGVQRAENAAFLDALVADGRPLPCDKAKLLDFMEAIDAGGAVLDFGEADKPSLGDFFRDKILKGLPKTVDFSERSGGDGLDFAEDAHALGVAAANYMADMAAKGITVTATAAVAHVKKGASA